jgi:hypothetical protein
VPKYNSFQTNLYYSLKVYRRRPHFRGARFCHLPHALRVCHLPPPSRASFHHRGFLRRRAFPTLESRASCASFHPRGFLRRRGSPALESRPRIPHPRIKQRLVPCLPRIKQPRLPSTASPAVAPSNPARGSPTLESSSGGILPSSNRAAAASFDGAPSFDGQPRSGSPRIPPVRHLASRSPAYYGRGDASTGNTPRGSSHMTRPRRPRYTTRSAVAPPLSARSPPGSGHARPTEKRSSVPGAPAPPQLSFPVLALGLHDYGRGRPLLPLLLRRRLTFCPVPQRPR